LKLLLKDSRVSSEDTFDAISEEEAEMGYFKIVCKMAAQPRTYLLCIMPLFMVTSAF
jgi:hypothetical protein